MQIEISKWLKALGLIYHLLTGDEIETPSGTITSLRLSSGSKDTGSPPRKRPAYCFGFHSFTYDVGGSREKGETGQNNTIWEDESFDADSPNVWQTRTVVDLEESGSPTFHCEWNLETEEGGLSNATSQYVYLFCKRYLERSIAWRQRFN